MAAIGEESLPWFTAERVEASPDLAALVRDYSGLLYRVAYSVLRNAAEAEDVVQDVFLRVLERQHALAQVVEVRPWLVRIAFNLALDRARRLKPAQMDETFAAQLASASVPADRALDEAAQIAQVLAAIERLPTRERQALLLSAIDELSAVEIAVVLRRSESSVRSLIFRARARLRQRLEDYG